MRDAKENSNETRDLQKKLQTLIAENKRSNDLLQNERNSRQQLENKSTKDSKRITDLLSNEKRFTQKH